MHDTRKRLESDLFTIYRELNDLTSRCQEETKRLGENGKGLIQPLAKMERLEDSMKEIVAYLGKLSLLEDMKTAFSELESSTIHNTNQQGSDLAKFDELLKQMHSTVQPKHAKY